MFKRELRWSALVVGGLLLLGSSLLLASPQDTQNTNDSAITTAIQAKLFQDPALKTQDIRVSTQDAVVTLTGNVDTQDAQAAVDRIASMEPGVAKVIDSLSVGGSEASAPANVEYSNPAPADEPSQSNEQYSEPAPAPAPSQSANQGQYFGNSDPQSQSVSPTLVLPAGTLLSVRLTQWLSSDRNQAGDGFTATLQQPVVVNGWVVARRGQSLQGRVVNARKGGRIKGVSQLEVALTELTLVNGQQQPIQTRLIETSAGPSKGRDAGAIGTTTGLGAVIGAIAGGGEGAGIGAGAGAAAGVAGVLLTHGRPTAIPSEALLTFRLESPVNISTFGSQAAFRPVTQQDYAQNTLQQRPDRVVVDRPPYYYGAPGYWGYYGGPGYYPGWGFYGYPRWGYGPGFYGVYRFGGGHREFRGGGRRGR